MICTDALVPPAEMVRVSVPSVRESLTSVYEIVAVPLELITATPVSNPPTTSAAVTPDSVNGTEVPEATLVPLNVKRTVEPSLTDELLEDSE